jgi:hypothetical protein
LARYIGLAFATQRTVLSGITGVDDAFQVPGAAIFVTAIDIHIAVLNTRGFTIAPATLETTCTAGADPRFDTDLRGRTVIIIPAGEAINWFGKTHRCRHWRTSLTGIRIAALEFGRAIQMGITAMVLGPKGQTLSRAIYDGAPFRLRTNLDTRTSFIKGACSPVPATFSDIFYTKPLNIWCGYIFNGTNQLVWNLTAHAWLAFAVILARNGQTTTNSRLGR